jgi:hypothetical protein
MMSNLSGNHPIRLTKSADLRVVERQRRYIHPSVPSEIWERTLVQNRVILVLQFEESYTHIPPQ